MLSSKIVPSSRSASPAHELVQLDCNLPQEASEHRMMSALVDWFIPTSILTGDRYRVSRARLLATAALMVAFLASVYAPVFYLMHSMISAHSLVAGAAGCFLSALILRISKSPAVSGAVLIVAYMTTLSVICARHGGIGAAAAPWYAVIPAFALCTFGWRTALACVGVVLFSSASLYLTYVSGYAFPQDVSPHQFQFLWVISIAGLTLLLLCLARHHELTRN